MSVVGLGEPRAVRVRDVTELDGHVLAPRYVLTHPAVTADRKSDLPGARCCARCASFADSISVVVSGSRSDNRVQRQVLMDPE